LPVLASRISIAPMPPMPLIQGSATPTAKAVAIAASTALPPPRSTSAPISAATRWWDATTPFGPATAAFRML